MKNIKELNLMKIIIWMIILIFNINFIFGSQNWFNESFEYRSQINLTNTGNLDLIDFPVYVNISKSINMQLDYDDVQFVLGDCLETQTTILDYEFEYGDSNHGEFWLKIPSFKSGINQICMYYGNSTMIYSGTDSAVWNNNFGIVYHMKSGGIDSTNNNRNRVSDVGVPIQNNSILGYGLTFDGNDGWDMTNIAYWESAWYNRVHSAIFETSNDITTRQTIYAEGGGVNGILMYIRSNQLYVRWWSESQGWSGDYLNTTILANTKYSATMSFEDIGGEYKYSLYLNGELISNRTTLDYMNAHSGDGGIGYTGSTSKDFDDSTGTGVYFIGNIYELRVQDNFESDQWYKETYQNTLNHSSNSNYGLEEMYVPELNININSPSTIAILSKLQNKTFELNATISCIGKSSSSCGNISLFSQYNNSINSFINISEISSTNPMWTSSSNSQNCILSGGQNCSINYIINLTGPINSEYLIKMYSISNISEIKDYSSNNLSVKIVAGEVVSFNRTSYTFTPFEKYSGNKIKTLSISADIGNNSNLIVSCLSGDCLYITENFVDGINLNEGFISEFNFTCNDNIAGNYSAIFNVTSNEFLGSNKITINCEVLPIYGPISAILNFPIESSTKTIGQNKTFILNATMNCNGICSNVSAFAVYNLTHNPFGDGRDGSLTISSLDSIVNNYTYLTITKNIGDNIISVNSALEFNVGDEIMIHHVQNGSGIGNAGDYEFNFILSKNANDLTLEKPLKFDFGSGIFNTTNASVTQIIKIPQYSDVTITSTGSITSKPWDGYSGGIVIFRVSKFLDTIGYINTTAKGFRGGDCNGCGDGAWGDQGEGFPGIGVGSLTANGNGGGGGYGPSGYNGEPGAGGAYGSAGGDGTSSFTSNGGLVIGDSTLSNIFFGGGAGGGGDDDNPTIKAQYIDGAGSVIIFAQKIINARILANGENGIGNGGFSGVTGGGGGGAIWLSGYNVTLNDVKAIGGNGFSDSDDNGGDGGDGRIRLDYYTSTGSTNPVVGYIGTFFELINAISQSSGTIPFWTSTSNPQYCLVNEDGSCSFEWVINATGEINTSVNMSVFVISSDNSRIATNISGFTTINITDNIIPTITLFYPSSNLKFLSDGEVQFQFRVDDDSATNNCSLYLDNIFNQSFICNTGLTNYINLTLNSKTYNWTIQAEDVMSNKINSTIWNFTLINYYNTTIEKSILYENLNQYLVNINIKNLNNINNQISLIEFIHSTFMAGSWSELFNWSEILSYGNIYGFNNTINSTSNKNYNYSISGISNYKLKKHFIVGIE